MSNMIHLLFIVMVEVIMTLADTEDSGIVLSGFIVSNLRFADDPSMADRQTSYRIKSS